MSGEIELIYGKRAKWEINQFILPERKPGEKQCEYSDGGRRCLTTFPYDPSSSRKFCPRHRRSSHRSRNK
jgi:hypothetical protein